jgi:hypothetical protein
MLHLKFAAGSPCPGTLPVAGKKSCARHASQRPEARSLPRPIRADSDRNREGDGG